MKKRKFLFLPLILLLIFPAAVCGNNGNVPLPLPETGEPEAVAPPIEQPLVPEGYFALQLLEALNLGKAQNEAQAESMLSGIGVEPKNGWIAGYPVTPPVIEEIERSVVAAADAGKLGMDKNRALAAVTGVKIKMGIDVTPGSAHSANMQQGAPTRAANNVIYKYVDKNGVIHYTDRYESIPREYHGNLEIIRGTGQRPQVTQAQAPENIPPLAPEGGVTDEQVYYPPANPDPAVINNYYYNEGPPVVTYYPPPQAYDYLYSWVPYPFWCSGLYFRGFFILHDFHRRIHVPHQPFVVTNHVLHPGTHSVSIVDPVTRGWRTGTASGRNTPHNPGFASPSAQTGARKIYVSTQNRNPAPAVPGSRVNQASLQARPQAPVRREASRVHRQTNQPMYQPRPTSGPASTIQSRVLHPSSVAPRPGNPGSLQAHRESTNLAPVQTFQQSAAPVQVHREFPTPALQNNFVPPSAQSQVFNPPSTISRGTSGGVRPGGGVSMHTHSGGWGGGFGSRR